MTLIQLIDQASFKKYHFLKLLRKTSLIYLFVLINILKARTQEHVDLKF